MENLIKNVGELEQTNIDDQAEKCVICGAETPYKLSTPISQREFYVEGSGQICMHCHYKIYIKKNRQTD